MNIEIANNGETANLMDGDSDKSGVVMGDGGAATAATVAASVNSNQPGVSASPASLSMSPSVAGGLSNQGGGLQPSTTSQQQQQNQSSTTSNPVPSAVLAKLQQRRRTSIMAASSFERARTIDNQEAGSSGKPDGSFEFSHRIKNSTSTELNE